MRRIAASIMLSVSQAVGERILSLAATESEYRLFWTQVLGALDFFLEVGLAADIRSISSQQRTILGHLFFVQLTTREQQALCTLS